MRLKDIYMNYLTDAGIFKFMTDAPWFGKADPKNLQIMYIGMHSGSKLVSPLVSDMLEGNNLNVADDNINKTLASVLLSNFNTNWTKLYNTLSLDYNPIENYSMTEIGEDINKENNSSTLAHGLTTVKNSTNTQTNDLVNTSDFVDTTKQVVTKKLDNKNVTDSEGAEKIFGFNSNAGNDSNSAKGQTTVTNSGTDTDTVVNSGGTVDTTTDTGTVTNVLEDSTTNSGSDVTTVEASNKMNHKLTRSGNIGVTTSQQMIQSERDLWEWNFFDKVFRDIDTFLTIPIY